MAKQYSSYQKQVIRNYYDNIDTIALTKLSELVTEIYLAETKKKHDKLWEQVEKALVKLKVPPKIAQHIVNSKKPELLAKHISDWSK